MTVEINQSCHVFPRVVRSGQEAELHVLPREGDRFCETASYQVTIYPQNGSNPTTWI